MATTYPLPDLAAKLTPAGVEYPTFEDTLLSLQAKFRSIYGNDVYLEPDSQDGQWLAYLAQLIYDQNQAFEATVLSFDPTYAQGVNLSSLVKINGLTRKVATNSTVELLIGADVGTVINNGQAAGADGSVWLLPATVTVGGSGTATVTATAAREGAITAAASTITNIRTPVLGWRTVTNPSDAVAGSAVEQDPALRARQSESQALPSLTVLEGILADVRDLPGVAEAVAYENDTSITNGLGITSHSIALVVEGGDSTDIANIINIRKTPGTGTFGSTTVNVTDQNGLDKPIKFSRPTANPLKMSIQLQALSGYTSDVGDQVKQALSDWIAGLPMGATIYYSRLFFPAQLFMQGRWESFEVNSLQIAKLADALGTADITQGIAENAVLDISNITLTVV